MPNTLLDSGEIVNEVLDTASADPDAVPVTPTSPPDMDIPPAAVTALSQFAQQPPPPADELTVKSDALDELGAIAIDAQIYYLASAAKVLKELGEEDLAHGCIAKLRGLFHPAD